MRTVAGQPHPHAGVHGGALTPARAPGAHEPPVVGPRPALVRPTRAVVGLCVVIGAMAAVAAAAGLFWVDGSAPASVVSVHGETVVLDGAGPYRWDSVFRGAANRGSDAVTLLLVLPALVASVRLYRRSSPGSAIVLCGALTWFAYLYASMSLGSAYNELFLLYVALFGSSVVALLLTCRSLDAAAVHQHLDGSGVRRRLCVLMAAGGAVTAAVWVLPLLGSALAGEQPQLLDHSTTMVTDALDLALITPATVAAAWLLHHRRPSGYLLAVPLLGLLALLLPMIVAQTLFQVAAGVQFTAAQVVGPIGGFVLLAGLAVGQLRGIVRHLPGRPGRTGLHSPARRTS